VITSAATAQYSRAQGGFASILTKSGGNEFQGTFKMYSAQQPSGRGRGRVWTQPRAERRVPGRQPGLRPELHRPEALSLRLRGHRPRQTLVLRHRRVHPGGDSRQRPPGGVRLRDPRIPGIPQGHLADERREQDGPVDHGWTVQKDDNQGIDSLRT
jgi:hypothetical protein